jgi:hypothetical protein
VGSISLVENGICEPAVLKTDRNILVLLKDGEFFEYLSDCLADPSGRAV